MPSTDVVVIGGGVIGCSTPPAIKKGVVTL